MHANRSDREGLVCLKNMLLCQLCRSTLNKRYCDSEVFFPLYKKKPSQFIPVIADDVGRSEIFSALDLARWKHDTKDKNQPQPRSPPSGLK